jgi:hypothetical protein
MPRFIARITVVTPGAAGSSASQVLYKPKKKKKRKLSRWARPFERLQRRLLEAQQVYSDEMLDRNRRSNRKRKDGFLRDGSINMLKAQRKALKRLKKL